MNVSMWADTPFEARTGFAPSYRISGGGLGWWLDHGAPFPEGFAHLISANPARATTLEECEKLCLRWVDAVLERIPESLEAIFIDHAAAGIFPLYRRSPEALEFFDEYIMRPLAEATNVPVMLYGHPTPKVPGAALGSVVWSETGLAPLLVDQPDGTDPGPTRMAWFRAVGSWSPRSGTMTKQRLAGLMTVAAFAGVREASVWFDPRVATMRQLEATRDAVDFARGYPFAPFEKQDETDFDRLLEAIRGWDDTGLPGLLEALAAFDERRGEGEVQP